MVVVEQLRHLLYTSRSSNHCICYKEEPSQSSMGKTAQSLTCYIMEKSQGCMNVRESYSPSLEQGTLFAQPFLPKYHLPMTIRADSNCQSQPNQGLRADGSPCSTVESGYKVYVCPRGNLLYCRPYFINDPTVKSHIRGVSSIMMHCRNTLFNFPRVTSLSTACKQTKLDANQSAVMDSLPPRVTSLSTACKQSKLDAKALVLE